MYYVIFAVVLALMFLYRSWAYHRLPFWPGVVRVDNRRRGRRRSTVKRHD
jgi:hypothetical protein